jgi:hypothetical protein
MKGIQPRFVVSVPSSLSQGFAIVSDAAKAAGLEPGIVVGGNFLGESLVIQNVGNVTTTILKSGEIIVGMGEVTLLRLIP